MVYDIGGFNGIFGLLAAKVNPRAKIVIFEPDPISVRHIRENIKINNLGRNCTVEEVALSNIKGTATFTADGTTGGRLASWGKSVTIDMLDSYPPADLIKIDVEGAEADVIAGGIHALQKRPVIILEVHPWLSEKDRGAMWATLKALGYSWKQEDNDEGNPHYLIS